MDDQNELATQVVMFQMRHGPWQRIKAIVHDEIDQGHFLTLSGTKSSKIAVAASMCNCGIESVATVDSTSDPGRGVEGRVLQSYIGELVRARRCRIILGES